MSERRVISLPRPVSVWENPFQDILPVVIKFGSENQLNTSSNVIHSDDHDEPVSEFKELSKKKKKRILSEMLDVGDYDMNDPFIDDSEIVVQFQELSSQSDDALSLDGLGRVYRPTAQDYYVFKGSIELIMKGNNLENKSESSKKSKRIVQDKEPRKTKKALKIPQEQQVSIDIATNASLPISNQSSQQPNTISLADYDELLFNENYQSLSTISENDQRFQDCLLSVIKSALVVMGWNLGQKSLFSKILSASNISYESFQKLSIEKLVPNELDRLRSLLQTKFESLKDLFQHSMIDGKVKFSSQLRELLYEVICTTIEIAAMERFLQDQPSLVKKLRNDAYQSCAINVYGLTVPDISKQYNRIKRLKLKRFQKIREKQLDQTLSMTTATNEPNEQPNSNIDNNIKNESSLLRTEINNNVDTEIF